MKQCKRCLSTKALDYFRQIKNKNGKFYYQATCKICERELDRIWYKENRETQREKLKIKSRKNLYGLSNDDYISLIQKQSSTCAICGTSNPSGKGSWHVDHSHTTGKIRGLLCHKCNTGLGLFLDNPFLLLKAKEYLDEHQ